MRTDGCGWFPKSGDRDMWTSEFKKDAGTWWQSCLGCVEQQKAAEKLCWTIYNKNTHLQHCNAVCGGCFFLYTKLFKIMVKTGNISHVPSLESFLSDNNLNLTNGVIDNIVTYFVSFRQQFSKYFPGRAEVNSWMRNPFNIKASDMSEDFTVVQQESLIELSCDETLRSAFRNQTWLDFWIQLPSKSLRQSHVLSFSICDYISMWKSPLFTHDHKD